MQIKQCHSIPPQLFALYGKHLETKKRENIVFDDQTWSRCWISLSSELDVVAWSQGAGVREQDLDMTRWSLEGLSFLTQCPWLCPEQPLWREGPLTSCPPDPLRSEVSKAPSITGILMSCIFTHSQVNHSYKFTQKNWRNKKSHFFMGENGGVWNHISKQ